MESIGKRLKEIRKEQKLTQSEFANLFGLSQSHFSNIENGRENPSETLILFICSKFNIDQEWLVDGVGSPTLGWDVHTDEGAIAKYNAIRVQFEQKLRQRSGEDLVNIIETFAYLDALLSSEKLNFENTSLYLKYVRLVIDNFERLIFQVSKSTLSSKKDAQIWMRHKNRCNEHVDRITENVKNAANLFLIKYGNEMKL